MHSLQYRGIAAVAMNILVLMEVYSCHTATVKGSTIHKFLSLTSTSVAQGTHQLNVTNHTQYYQQVKSNSTNLPVIEEELTNQNITPLFSSEMTTNISSTAGFSGELATQ
ncbi:hypothetical protein EB796_014167 [Bugula neritina]|uniref:Uncharacterized protein n=1 Tax=Bugula neritina TaxID=10212 RepID=A0A7J7JN58_BUGNE|nr:hypothetical protein EB796_014167 [Bugula neritina]